MTSPSPLLDDDYDAPRGQSNHFRESVEPASQELSWVRVTDRLWVASRAHNFVGTIEQIEERFVALDGRAVPIGVNGSLEGAQRRFAELADMPASKTPRRTMRFASESWRRVRRD